MDNNIQAGQMIGPYQVTEQLGQGGMATVYKAYHAAVDRYVAIKILPRHFALDPQFTGRFKQEAKFIANLEHPHILPIYDYGESDGLSYLVMRYMEAGTLRDRIAAGPLTLNEVDAFFSQIADALDYAHAKGVIHRDLKPANVLIDTRGSAFLTDFGIAKIIEGTSHFTNTGAVIGTPAYMSPEQGQGLKLDQRSDLYSLGIVLYEMITGRVPYNAETPFAIIFKHLYDPLPLPTSLRPGLPDPIERVILKALAKNPNDRFSSAREFLDNWKKALLGLTSLATSTITSSAVTPTGATVVSPASPTITGPTPPAPQAMAAPGRTFPRKFLVGGALALVGLFLVIALAAIVISQVRGRLQESQQANDSNPQGSDTQLPAGPITPPIPVREANYTWTTYVSPNIIRSLAVYGDEIITGGLDSVSFWNRQDGSLIRQFTPNDGLSGPEISNLWIDDDGTIWAASDNGLGHYDPTNQQWYTFNQTDGLLTGAIQDIIRRQNGQLLVGTIYGNDGEGLALYDGQNWIFFPGFPSTGSLERDPDMLSATVTSLIEDQNGHLWVGTVNGLGFFDGREWQRYAIEDGLPSNEITVLNIDAQNRVLVGTTNGAAYQDGNHFLSVPNLADNTISGFIQSQDGQYWLTGEEPGLLRFDPLSGESESYPDTYYWSGAIAADDGNLYFGTSEGIVRYSNGQFTLWSESNAPTQDNYSRILLSPDNKLWFVHGSHTDIFDPAGEGWAKLEDIPCCAEALAFDDSGRLWAGDYGQLWILTDREQIQLTQEDGLPPSPINSIVFFANGGISLGTEAGLVLMDKDRPTTILTAASSGFASDNITVLFADSQETMWVGTDFGLSHLLPDHIWQHYTIGDPFGDNLQTITDIAEGLDGSIWIATIGDGLYHFTNDTFEHFMSENSGSHLPPPDLHALAVSSNGDVWVGADYNGLYRFDGQTWSYFGPEDGLASTNISDILVTPDGTVWATGSLGISKYTP